MVIDRAGPHSQGLSHQLSQEHTQPWAPGKKCVGKFQEMLPRPSKHCQLLHIHKGFSCMENFPYSCTEHAAATAQLCGCKHLHNSCLAPAPAPMSPPAEQVPAVPVSCSTLEQSVTWQFDPFQEASIWSSCEFGNGFSPRTRECNSLQILLQGLTGLMGI